MQSSPLKGDVLNTKRNIAARAGRWSARHRKTAIFGWLAFVIVAFMVGGMTGTNNIENKDSGVGESGAAMKAMSDAFPDEKAGEQVLLQSKKLSASDPAFKAAVADVGERLGKTKHVEELESPYKTGDISKDGHSALVKYEIPGDELEVADRVEAPLAAIAASAKANPQTRIEPFGDASFAKGVKDLEGDDFSKAEKTSLPLTLIVLVFAFGALVAAGVPLLLALTGVFATLGLVGPVSQISPVSPAIMQVILLVGLAVGVDYAMFYMRRVKEARLEGHDNETAIEIAASTSGRAVLISGMTVMISMAGMYLAGASTFASFATGTIMVVAVAVIGSLTVLPAVLSALGDKVNKGRVPGLDRLKRRVSEYGVWSRIIDRVLRRPLLSAVVSGGLLVALAVPTLGMNLGTPGLEAMPKIAVIQTYDRIQDAFPTENVPVMAVVEASDVTGSKVTGAIADLNERTSAQPGLFKGPADVEVSDDRSVAVVSVPGAGNGTDKASNEALDEFRSLADASFGSLEGVTVNIGGENASSRDFSEVLTSHIAYVFAFVLSAAFLLLLVTFRSLVIPIKAILLNLLSVGAAYGLLVTVFQTGLADKLGLESTGSIVAWLPPFLFVILFGLSMDYHVLILTRVREAFDDGMSTEDAVSHGIKSTAGVVTSAAIVMVGVFGLFGLMSTVDMQQMGIGLAAAVLIDATLIRGVLLPATMKLLGDRNWWLPAKLQWLPKVQTEREVVAATT